MDDWGDILGDLLELICEISPTLFIILIVVIIILAVIIIR